MGPADDAEKSDRVGDRRGLDGRSSSVPPNVVPYRSILRSRAEEKALSLRPKSQTGASKGRETFERTSTPGGGLVDLDLRGSKVRPVRHMFFYFQISCFAPEYATAAFNY